MVFQPRLLNLPRLRCSGILLGIVTIALVGTGCAQLKKMTAPPANSATTALANHLNQEGAKMYGTYWCPYCSKQKEMFGAAISKLKVIECDPNGENAQPQLCAQANVSSYPTWEIKGKLYQGLRSLEDLAILSNYRGPTDFQQ